MKTGLKMFIVLTAIALLSGGLLSALNSMTADRIKAHRAQELKAAIADVLPKYDYYDVISKGAITLYVGKTKQTGKPVGVATRVVGNGFQGKISMMIGISPDFTKLTGFKVLEQVETPGLGSKIDGDPTNQAHPFWFAEQFKGLVFKPIITIIKNVKPTKPNEIEAISGATISSKSVVGILNNQLPEIEAVYEAERE